LNRSTLNFLVDALAVVLGFAVALTGLLLRYVLPPGSRGGWGLALLGWDRHDWGDLHFWLSVGLVLLMLVHLVLHWSWVWATACRMAGAGGGSSLDPGRARRTRVVYGLLFLAGLAFLLVALVLLAQALVARDGSGRGGHGHGRSRTDAPGAVDRQADGSAGPLPGTDPDAGDAGRREGAFPSDGTDRSMGHGAGASRDGGRIRGSMTLREAAEASGLGVDRLRARLGLPDTVPPDERLGRILQAHGLTMSDVRQAVETDSGPGSGDRP